MLIDQRDLTITQLVSRFGQLSSMHIQKLVFSNLKSHTPASRSLNRLVSQKYLARIERKIVGGSRGGSGQFVYQLGAEGHRMFREGRYNPARAINYHSLAIAGCYVGVVQLEQQGLLHIRGYTTEPDCHVTIKAGVREYQLKPDLYLELERQDGSNQLRVMVEIDMGTQGQRQIIDKFARYWGAHTAASDAEWPANQFVFFVAVDDHRAEELRWMLAKGSPEQRVIFRVYTLGSLLLQLHG